MKKIVILGGGESGVGAAILAQQKNYEVLLSEAKSIKKSYKEQLIENNIEFEENGHNLERMQMADMVIKSPGIPEKASVIQYFRERSIPVISEIEFAALHTKAKIVAITGSNGKTTTTSLIYHILRNEGFDVALAGNIGKSFARQVAEGTSDFYVIEVSSFQLDDIQNFQPHIAILLNITPDHLDRYEDKMEHYIRSKFRVTMNQKQEDYFIYSLEDQEIQKALKLIKTQAQCLPFSVEQIVDRGAYLTDKQLVVSVDAEEPFYMDRKDLALPGKHNAANSMAAGIAAKLLKVRKETLKQSLENFESIPHRLEKVLQANQVQYINDSKATNVNAVYYALESISTPIVWIAGGQDKGNDYTELFDLVKNKVKALVCLGVDNEKLMNVFEGKIKHIVNTHSMAEAVHYAIALSEKEDTVLLAPACASFDLFENYEDRGNQFKEELKKVFEA